VEERLSLISRILCYVSLAIPAFLVIFVEVTWFGLEIFHQGCPFLNDWKVL